MLIKSNVKAKGQKRELFPISLFSGTDVKSEDVMKTIENELKEKKNHKTELNIYEKTELGKQLIESSKNGNLEKVKELIEKGVNLNFQNNMGDTALILSIEHNREEVARLLINKGADVNVQENTNNTALMRAARHGRLEIIKLLIDKVSNLNIKNKCNKTAFILAVDNKHKKIIEFLIDAGAEVPFNYLHKIDLKDFCKYAIKKLQKVFA